MKGFLRLGSVKGIKLEVHWTFVLLLVWVAFIEFRTSGDIKRVLISEGFVLALMCCVVLHELGHAFMARRFNVLTTRIVLLPIGGVATMDKISEKPRQELLIALAGPAVNLVIALLLALILPIKSYFNFGDIVLEERLFEPSLVNFLFYLFIANLLLVLFNLIPAFPMDGGRVLRALLTFRLGKVKATKIASVIGQGMAFVFLIFGLFFNPFLILISFFIYFGAYGENKMVRLDALLEGHSVEEATLTNITLLHPENTIGEVVEIILSGTEKNFVVLSKDKLVGILTNNTILKNAKNPLLPIKKFINEDYITLDANLDLADALELLGKHKNGFFPVLESGEFIGAIDMTNLQEFILFKTVS